MLWPCYYFVSTIPQLKEEFPAYVAASENTDPSKTREFWMNHKDQLPTWCSSYQKVMLVQPSSAASERVFSILNNSFTTKQQQSLQDLIEASVIVMLQYNR